LESRECGRPLKVRDRAHVERTSIIPPESADKRPTSFADWHNMCNLTGRNEPDDARSTVEGCRSRRNGNRRPNSFLIVYTYSEAVNLSTAAVQRRIAAMEEAGIVTRNVAIVDPDAVALAITAIVEVNLCDERAATVDAAKSLFRLTAEVQQCFYVNRRELRADHRRAGYARL